MTATRTVLIVDDHPINRTLAAVLLRDSGWASEQAASGSEALAMLAAKTYDCVLLDISMPEMSGEEVCKRIRADARLAGLRVIAYTAHTMKDEQQQILAAGFDALLIKPINKAVLLETINAA